MRIKETTQGMQLGKTEQCNRLLDTYSPDHRSVDSNLTTGTIKRGRVNQSTRLFVVSASTGLLYEMGPLSYPTSFSHHSG